MSVMLLLSFLFSLIVTYLLIVCNFQGSRWVGQWHGKSKTPTLGGIAVYATIILGLFLIERLSCTFFWLVSLLFLVGMIDDLFDIAAYIRLLMHIIVACLVVISSSNNMTYYDSVIVVLLMVVMINAMNVIDNMDGLCSGVGIIASLFLYVLYRDIWILFLAIGLSGFVVFNFPKAKIYMGDCGSTVVGFLLVYYVVTQPVILVA